MEFERVEEILTALAVGFMIGLQRSIAHGRRGEPVIMGSRTFALIALLGYLGAWLEEFQKGLLPAVFAAAALLIAGAYAAKVWRTKRLGLTTPVAALTALLLGAMPFYDLGRYALFIAVVVVLLLEIKPKLRRLEESLSPEDINAVLLLLVMSFVILPLLPDRFVGPYNLINPYKTWLMAILIASISFIGYIAIKFLGHRYGIFVTGAAGGLISSTAVTISLSRLYRAAPHLLKSFAGGIAIACTFMFLRVLVEAALVNPQLAARLAIPYLLASGVGLGYVYYLYRASGSAQVEWRGEGLQTNPLQLSEAIKFAILFGIIYGAIHLAKERFGDAGVYLVSLISGVTDVDAITLSLSQMAREGSLAERAAMAGIVIASATNSIVKLALAYLIGGARLGWELTKFFALTLGALFGGLYFAI